MLFVRRRFDVWLKKNINDITITGNLNIDETKRKFGSLGHI